MTRAVPSHKYGLTVVWSRDDSVFVVDVPELPGCMAHGSTVVEAVVNADAAIDLWLDTAREARRPVPEPAGRRPRYP